MRAEEPNAVDQSEGVATVPEYRSSVVDEIHIIHHNHLDIGFSYDQPIVWDLHRRHIDTALEACHASLRADDTERFRWTCESSLPVLKWFETATDDRIDLFLDLEREGLIEITALPMGITPNSGPAQLREAMRPVETLREEYGCTINHAISCCVNGQNWPIIDVLLDAGIESLIMAVDQQFGGSPLTRPLPFRWRGPSERSILAWNGYLQSTGYRMGIGKDMEAFRRRWLPELLEHLDQMSYPLSTLLLPWGGYNAPPYPQLTEFIETWNESEYVSEHGLPKIRVTTPSAWWNRVREEADELETYRGDWTDYWNFGCASAAREQAVNRENRRRLWTADALSAALDHLEPYPEWHSDRESRLTTRHTSWWETLLFDEHTWSATVSVSDPENEDTHSQWYQKAAYAYRARSRSLMLRRDSLAELSRKIAPRGDEPEFVIVNPLPWSREIQGPVSSASVTGLSDAFPDSELLERHHQDRHLGRTDFYLPSTEVPGYGYRVIERDDLIMLDDWEISGGPQAIDTGRFAFEFDCETGGIAEWYDNQLGCEWVEQSDQFNLASLVHETLDQNEVDPPRSAFYDMSAHDDDVVIPETGWNTEWPARRRVPTTVDSHEVRTFGDVTLIEQDLSTPVVDDVEFRYWVRNDTGELVIDAGWTMGTNTAPESTYLAFPFNLDSPSVKVDVGGVGIRPNQDQLPGACRDFFTVQDWFALSHQDRSMAVGCPLNPLVQFGGFNFGSNLEHLAIDDGLVLGWITNNYWNSNYRAHQPGRVHARYHLRPAEGKLDETFAHRVGKESAHWRPLVHARRSNDLKSEEVSLPTSGAILELPDPPVLVERILPSDGNEIGFTHAARRDTFYPRHPNREQQGENRGTPPAQFILRNGSAAAQRASFGSGVLWIERAERVDEDAKDRPAPEVSNGTVTVQLRPRETARIALHLTPRH